MPGWYPDPAGDQGRYRYWDGAAWSNQTTTNPAQQPPPGGGFGGPAAADSGSGRPGGRTGGGRWTWLLIVAALVALAVVGWLVLGGSRGGGFVAVPEDTNSAAPTVTGWDETSRPTPPPTTAASVVTCPYTTVTDQTQQGRDGRLRAGGISVQGIQGWEDYDMYLQWVSDFHSQVDEVRPGWISNIGVGQLNAVDGFTDPQTAARQSMECFASSGYYIGFTHRVDLASEATTIGGHPAWRIRSEVHIQSDSMPEIDGDLVDIIVIDLGDPQRMGIFVSSVTIGDTRRQGLVDASIASLTVG